MFSNQEITMLLFVKMVRYRLTRLNIPANIVSFVRVIAPYEAEWFSLGFSLKRFLN